MREGRKISPDIRQIALSEIVASEVKFLSFAEPGAMGDRGAVEVYCLGEKEIKYYYGNYVNGDLSPDDLYNVLPDSLCTDSEDELFRIDVREWLPVSMGMGNELFVNAGFYLMFKARLREMMPGHIYRIWHEAAEKTLFDELND